MANANIPPTDFEDLRLVRPRQLLELVPLSSSRIRQLEDAGEFPARIALGAHAVAWRASEVREWIEKRIALGAHAGKGATAKPSAAKKATKRTGGK